MRNNCSNPRTHLCPASRAPGQWLCPLWRKRSSGDCLPPRKGAEASLETGRLTRCPGTFLSLWNDRDVGVEPAPPPARTLNWLWTLSRLEIIWGYRNTILTWLTTEWQRFKFMYPREFEQTWSWHSLLFCLSELIKIFFPNLRLHLQ